jgi:hypothetical protein
LISRLGGLHERTVDDGLQFVGGAACARLVAVNDDQPAVELDALRAEHRSLDERIRLLSSEPTGDQLELARLKRRKLMLKDQIELIADLNIPDIIA